MEEKRKTLRVFECPNCENLIGIQIEVETETEIQCSCGYIGKRTIFDLKRLPLKDLKDNPPKSS